MKASRNRDKYRKDLLQPFHPDGTVNPEFIKVYKRDPRVDPIQRSYARNVHSKRYKELAEEDMEMRKWEKDKYGI